jgi:hypothetical protein
MAFLSQALNHVHDDCIGWATFQLEKFSHATNRKEQQKLFSWQHEPPSNDMYFVLKKNRTALTNNQYEERRVMSVIRGAEVLVCSTYFDNGFNPPTNVV